MKVTIKVTNVPILQVNRSQNPEELDFKVCAEKAAAQEDAEDAFNHGVARGTLRGTVRGTVHGTARSSVHGSVRGVERGRIRYGAMVRGRPSV